MNAARVKGKNKPVSRGETRFRNWLGQKNRIHTSRRILCCPGKFIDQISHVTTGPDTHTHRILDGNHRGGKRYSWMEERIARRSHYPPLLDHKCQLKMSFKLSLCAVYCSPSFGQLPGSDMPPSPSPSPSCPYPHPYRHVCFVFYASSTTTTTATIIIIIISGKEGKLPVFLRSPSFANHKLWKPEH